MCNYWIEDMWREIYNPKEKVVETLTGGSQDCSVFQNEFIQNTG